MKRSLDAIRRTIQILNSVSYENYSDEKTRSYLAYIKGSRADEDKLISPILLRKFLEEILDFELGKTIATQESKGVGKPDYIPVDTRTHPFAFDAKGTDSQDLSQHHPQIKKYIESRELKYGILTNMRDLDVYTSEKEIEIEEYNFNFIGLYQNYKENPKTCLEKENTKRFLNFVDRFSYKSLNKKEKIERIAKAKPWSGKEELNVRSLTDQLRHIVNILHNDARQKKSELSSMAEVGKVSAESIAYEIEEICARISGREMEEVNAETFNKIMNVDEADLYGKARDAFFRRVAYFAMTRLLLTRVWEDIGFIDQTLYDGGFAQWYKNSSHEIRRILHYAFNLSAERYPWLFNVNNNYSWYEPSDNSLIDSLYELSNFYLGKLDQDILGTIYEDYIEKVNKKNEGQYYTPREIVSLIWDRVGFNNPKAYFWHIEGKRRPKLIFDPATGSGGFLVEAARRIRECPDFDWDDFNDLLDARTAILAYLFGSEISPFPYYLTEVNLLIQLTPIIRRMMLKKQFKVQPYPLSVICVDSLSLYNLQPSLLPDETKEYKVNNAYKILSLDPQKKVIYQKIKEKLTDKFFYCCSNPPYVGEKGHKELFRQTLRLYPYWKKYYQGKMDYLYWFIVLGLSKLREWGKLGFITSAYWPTADGASKLRKYILKNAKIKEMIFFGDVKIFEHAKGQHNMVFVLTKCSGKEHKEERENNHIKIVQVKCKNQDLPGNTIREILDFLTKHIQKHIDKPRYEDKFIKIFWSGVKQGELPQDGGAWNEVFLSRSTKQFIACIESQGKPLQMFCQIVQGIVSGADRVTHHNIRLLPEEKIREDNVKVGNGIFILTQREKENLTLTSVEETLLHKTYKNSDINPYYVDFTNSPEIYIIYTAKETDIDAYPNIEAHLRKFKEILADRLNRYNESYSWFCLHREREEKLLSSTKIVTSRWGEDIKPFALQTGNFYENSDINLIIPKTETRESILYILGILNSGVIINWMRVKARQKGLTRQSILLQIPIHLINFEDPEEVRMHNVTVNKVKSIREKVAELAKYSKYFSGHRLTRLQFDAPLPEVNTEAIIKSIPPENLYNLRTHPEIKIEKPKNFEGDKFSPTKVEKPELILTGNAQLRLKGKNETVFIEGPYELLRLFFNVLSKWKGKLWSEIKENLLLPDNIVSFNTQKSKISNEVQDIRTEILQLQQEIDQIVYKLYGLTKEEIKIIEETVKS